MSIVVLSTGTEIRVVQDPIQARETLDEGLSSGVRWGHSDDGAQFLLCEVIAILPDPPRTRSSSAKKGAAAK